MSARINRFLTPAARTRRAGKDDSRDPQANRLYAMERSIAGWAIYAHVEEDDLQRIADYVCRKFRVPRVGVSVDNMGGTPDARVFGYCKESTIHLNADFHGDNTAVLVHEIAHYIVFKKFGTEVENHGPEFVWTYGKVLDLLNLIPLNAYLLMVEDYDLSYAGEGL